MTGLSGPAGPQGLPGISGYERIAPSEFYTVNPGEIIIHVHQCPGNKRVITGGFRDNGESLKVIWNEPMQDGIGWSWRIQNPTVYTHTFQVSIVCVNVSA